MADWVFRAFARSRKPGPLFSGSRVADDQLNLSADPPRLTARVACGTCNNGWMSRLDNAAARALRPIIQRQDSVDLMPEGQLAVAAWVFKSALVFDAWERGDAGQLVTSRAVFASTQQAPEGCAIQFGPSPPTPFPEGEALGAPFLVLFGIEPTFGVLNLTLAVADADGAGAEPTVSTLPIPGYRVRLGHAQAIISGAVFPIVPDPGQGFERIWPVQAPSVTVTSRVSM